MKKRLYGLVLAGLLVFAACQPTPEKEAVVNKGDGVYEQKVEVAKKEERTEEVLPEASASPGPTEVPKYAFEPHWTDTVSLKNFDVTIDVDVEAPDTAIFPVYRVKSRPFALEDDRWQAICRVLMGNVTAERPGGATVQDLKEQLEALEKGQYDVENQTWRPYSKETYNELAGDIMKELQTAPEEGDFTPVSEVRFEQMPAEKVFQTEEGVLWEVQYQETWPSISRYLRGTPQPERWVLSGTAMDGEEPSALKNVSCTEEEARQFVKDFFEEVQVGDIGISRIEKGRVVDADTSQVLKEGWIVECARKGGNCPAFHYRYYKTSGTLRFSEDAYSAGLPAESIQLFVDEEGVASISWLNPLEVIGTEVQNVEILPFAQVQELIKQAIFNGLSWTGNKKSGSAFYSGFYTTRVILSYCFAPVKDAPEEFYFTPAWFVLLQSHSASAAVAECMIVINAVDGTRMDPKA